MPTHRPAPKKTPPRLWQRAPSASLVFAAALSACGWPAYEVAQEPLGHCENALYDSALGETDFDCGGGCSACALGRHCASVADCVEGTCSQGVCVASSCTNRVKDGAETSVDCGGSCAPCNLPDPGNPPDPGVPGDPPDPGDPVTCAAGFADCNARTDDGCEAELATSNAHCGACQRACAIDAMCLSGTCQTRTEPEPERDITVASTAQHAMSAWDGNNQAGSIVRADHTLGYARGDGRVLLLGISGFGTGAGAFTPRYDDVPMTLAIELEHPARQSYAAVYYLLDEQLPAAAGTISRAEVTFNAKAWWGLGGFTVLELRNARQQKPSFAATSAADTCNSASTRGVRLDFSSPGALVFAVLSTHGDPKPPKLLSTPPLNEAWGEHVTNGNGHQTGSAAWILDDDSRMIDWATPNCWNSAAVGVVVERAPLSAGN